MTPLDSFILYIEDNHDDRELFLRCVKHVRPDISCLFAYTGQEALSVLRNTLIKPHCIFIDVNMPMIDGIQVLRQIKSSPMLRSTPCYVLTGSANATLVERAISNGANEFLTKPISFNELCTTISRVLNDFQVT